MRGTECTVKRPYQPIGTVLIQGPLTAFLGPHSLPALMGCEAINEKFSTLEEIFGLHLALSTNWDNSINVRISGPKRVQDTGPRQAALVVVKAAGAVAFPFPQFLSLSSASFREKYQKKKKSKIEKRDFVKGPWRKEMGKISLPISHLCDCATGTFLKICLL